MTGRTARTALRGLTVLTVSATPLLVLAAPAFAGGSITAPGSDGAVITSGATLAASATVSANSATTTFSLEGPGYAKASKSANRNLTAAQTLSFSVSTGDGTAVRNGAWTESLSGGASDTRTFYTSFPVAQPAGFTASGSGSRQVTFAWTKGSEPDLSTYTLDNSDGSVVQDGIDPSSACQGSSCSFALYYSSDQPGQHAFSLVAHRPGGGCPSCADQLTSDAATASATLDQPAPSSSPSSGSSGSGSSGGSGGSGGTSSGGGGGTSTGSGGTTSGGGTSTGSGGTSSGGGTTTGSGGTTTSSGGSSTSGGTTTTGSGGSGTASLGSLTATPTQRRDFALNYNSFGPSLGIPKLPPLVAASGNGEASGEAALPFGTYQQSLPYAPTTKTQASSPSAIRNVGSAVTSVLDTGRLVRSIAGALVLLLAFAHVRRWMAIAPDED